MIMRYSINIIISVAAAFFIYKAYATYTLPEAQMPIIATGKW